jgi:hypothetical protein
MGSWPLEPLRLILFILLKLTEVHPINLSKRDRKHHVRQGRQHIQIDNINMYPQLPRIMMTCRKWLIDLLQCIAKILPVGNMHMVEG